MSDQHERRLDRLRRAIRGDPIDAILIASGQNVHYLTGFTGDASVLLVSKDRTLLISDGRFSTQLADECPDLEVHVRPVEQLLFEAVGEVVNSFAAARVGFEPAKLTVAQFEKIREKAPTIELVGVAGRVEGLRSIKDKSEVEAIRSAIRQAERGFAMLRAALNPDDSEKDLADALEGYLRRCGASAAAFDPIVAVGGAGGLASCPPHSRRAGPRCRLRAGGLGSVVGGLQK